MARILHVDDEPQVTGLFRAELRIDLPQHEVTSFNSLAEAKEAVARGEHFDLFVLDGQIDKEGTRDGEDWAWELFQTGKRVLMNANRHPERDLPSVLKADTERLIRKIEELLGS